MVTHQICRKLRITIAILCKTRRPISLPQPAWLLGASAFSASNKKVRAALGAAHDEEPSLSETPAITNRRFGLQPVDGIFLAKTGSRKERSNAVKHIGDGIPNMTDLMSMTFK
jgi:hypothetical protein